jgi:prevent-host-death family protein
MSRRDEIIWQASEARAKFPAIVQGALSGVPQVIKHRSGGEVVVISRADYDAMRPTMKDYLLRGGPGLDDDDPVAMAIGENRRDGITVMGRMERTTRK